jgi:DHA1 family tetracycline resistance protein-like MFS transporter
VLLLGFCGLALNFFVTALATALWMLVACAGRRRHAGQCRGGQRLRGRHHAAEERAAASACWARCSASASSSGPVMGGLLGGIDLRLPFFVAGGAGAGQLAYGYFVLPESLPPEAPALRLAARQPAGVAAQLARLKGVGLLVG